MDCCLGKLIFLIAINIRDTVEMVVHHYLTSFARYERGHFKASCFFDLS